MHLIKILLDSHASASIVHIDILNHHHRILPDMKNERSTMAGAFNTTLVTKITLKLLELNPSTNIYVKSHLTNKVLNYNVILGRDILHELGIKKNITWQEKNDKPYHANPFPIPIPIIHKPTLKNEVNRLIKIGVLKKLMISNQQILLLLYLRYMVY